MWHCNTAFSAAIINLTAEEISPIGNIRGKCQVWCQTVRIKEWRCLFRFPVNQVSSTNTRNTSTFMEFRNTDVIIPFKSSQWIPITFYFFIFGFLKTFCEVNIYILFHLKVLKWQGKVVTMLLSSAVVVYLGGPVICMLLITLVVSSFFRRFQIVELLCPIFVQRLWSLFPCFSPIDSSVVLFIFFFFKK